MRLSLQIMRQEWRMHRASFISYTLGIWFVYLIFLFFFDTFKEHAQLLDEVMKNFPPAFKAAFGFSDVPLAQINGYLTFLFSYLILIAAIFGMKLGLSALSEEGRTKTADFLMTKPIKRRTIVTAKLLSILCLLVLQSVLLGVAMFLPLSVYHFEHLNITVFLLLVGSIPLSQLFFVGIGSLLAVSLRRVKNPMPLTLGIVFFFFIIQSLNESLNDKGLEYLTPFSYFKGSRLLNANAYELKFLLLDVLVFAITIAASYWIYSKKDVHAV